MVLGLGYRGFWRWRLVDLVEGSPTWAAVGHVEICRRSVKTRFLPRWEFARSKADDVGSLAERWACACRRGHVGSVETVITAWSNEGSTWVQAVLLIYCTQVGLPYLTSSTMILGTQDELDMAEMARMLPVVRVVAQSEEMQSSSAGQPAVTEEPCSQSLSSEAAEHVPVLPVLSGRRLSYELRPAMRDARCEIGPGWEATR